MDFAKVAAILEEKDSEILDAIRFLYLAIGYHSQQTLADFNMGDETCKVAE